MIIFASSTCGLLGTNPCITFKSGLCVTSLLFLIASVCKLPVPISLNGMLLVLGRGLLPSPLEVPSRCVQFV